MDTPNRPGTQKLRARSLLHALLHIDCFLLPVPRLVPYPTKVNTLEHISGLPPVALKQRQSHRKGTSVNFVTALRHYCICVIVTLSCSL